MSQVQIEHGARHRLKVDPRRSQKKWSRARSQAWLTACPRQEIRLIATSPECHSPGRDTCARLSPFCRALAPCCRALTLRSGSVPWCPDAVLMMMWVLGRRNREVILYV